MITKIKKIKNIRNLLDLSCDVILSKRNVFYAQNGTWKTNISRFFKSFSQNDEWTPPSGLLNELKSLEGWLIDYEFEVDNEVRAPGIKDESVDGLIVYNSDYIEENIRCLDFSNKKINGKLEIDLWKEQNNLKQLEDKKNELEKKMSTEKEQIEKKLKSEIDLIKEKDPKWENSIKLLLFENLTSEYHTTLEWQKDDQIKDWKNIEGWLSSEERLNKLQSIDPAKDKIKTLEVTISDVFDYAIIETYLTIGQQFPEALPTDFLAHVELMGQEWINKWVIFCDKNDNCPFCKNKIDAAASLVIQKYKEYIISAETKFKNDIDEQIKNIDTFIGSYNWINIWLDIVFQDRVTVLGRKETWENLESSSLITSLQTLRQNLVQKRSSPTDVIYAPPQEGHELDILKGIKRGIKDISINLEKNKVNITKINKAIQDIASRQADIRTLLGKKYLFNFYNSNKTSLDAYYSYKDQINSLKNDIDNEKKKLPSEDVATKIITLFNEFISLVGLGKYKAYLTEDVKIKLRLNDSFDISNQTQRISEGEKNAIAFCYFLASSIRIVTATEKFSKATFIIDDPICSMSYWYFYGICNLLKKFASIIQDKVWQKSSQQHPQVLIFTHNIQFYNMLVSNVYRDDYFFEIEIQGGKHLIQKQDREKKLSEYHTALRRVKQHSQDLNKENIWNDIRKVWETLCNFYWKNFSEESISWIFWSQELWELVLYCKDGSHEDVNNHEDPQDSNTSKKAAKKLIDLMQTEYPDLINSIR